MNKFNFSFLFNLMSSNLNDVDNSITDDGLFSYTLSDNEIVITRYLGCDSIVNVPSFIKNLPVTSIGPGAFSENVIVENVALPEVTTILPGGFFGCLSLKNIDMPKVVNLGTGSFADCPLLESVDISEVTLVDSWCFANSGIKSIALPQIITIGSEAFNICSSLESISLSKNLFSIGNSVFSNCPLASVTIDYGVDDISSVTLYDWNVFVSKLSGVSTSNITGKYIKNNLGVNDLTISSIPECCTDNFIIETNYEPDNIALPNLSCITNCESVDTFKPTLTYSEKEIPNTKKYKKNKTNLLAKYKDLIAQHNKSIQFYKNLIQEQENNTL